MNWVSILIALLLAAAVIAALLSARKHKGSCGGCSDYSGCDRCSRNCENRQR